MVVSIEEQELTAQRDAAVSLCKGLQEKVRRFVHSSSHSVQQGCGVTQVHAVRRLQYSCCSFAVVDLYVAGNAFLFICTYASWTVTSTQCTKNWVYVSFLEEATAGTHRCRPRLVG